MDASADHLMIVEEKYADFSWFAHESSLTHKLFP
ncbi:hypothetical protein M878_21145 [Streptomyces roseochromogenus subsp. oscitans DS 12.976]|uniref:Uncharacterized protein n=1 Tax=Streptomyces roseochromogenus subsp. oscitans DS 12.976 TaxID=1352936 RepID=V6KAP5_STRRC|nr:hypothetical protein M878_21145 [Streptomyces roseochromogenus subsp. oscitans DS 12.976]